MTRLCPGCWTNQLSRYAKLCRTCWARKKRAAATGRNDSRLRIRPSYRLMLAQLADRRQETMTLACERLITEAWLKTGGPVEEERAA